MGDDEAVVEHPAKGNWYQRRTSMEVSLLLLFCILLSVTTGMMAKFLLDQRDSSSRFPAPANPYDQKVQVDASEAQRIRDLLIAKTDPANKDAEGMATPDRIRRNLRMLTTKVHPAGTNENHQVGQLIYEAWQSQGLDEVKFFEYDDVLLSYPDWEHPAQVHAWDDGLGAWSLISNGTARPLGPPEALTEEDDQRARIWWNAYAANGTAEAEIVYANYGRIEDYDYLARAVVNISGKIVIVRYGGLWRGAKVYEAEKRGAVGVIMYMDPKDYGPPGNDSDWVFPESIYMPPSGAQRGTLFQNNGDPLTPLYPAKNYTFRSTSEEELRRELLLPGVPVMPMGYEDARRIMAGLDGAEAPAGWSGGFNLTYKLSGSRRHRMTVNMYTQRSRLRNVVGFLRGNQEPDRYVILGNHYDAWTFGAQDPNSGTAVNLELARVFMEIVNETGWRPRRTLVFAAWDAEEYGLMGSVEFTEELMKLLEFRAVAYVNVDIAVQGNVSLTASSVPLLYRALARSTKEVANPNPDEVAANRRTVYDSFKYWNPLNGTDLPQIDNPGSGSDFESFLDYIGVPVVDLTFDCEPDDCYKLYHSMYEVAWTVENLVDPDFTVHTALLRVWAELARDLADSLVIPFNVTDYAVQIEAYVRDMDRRLRAMGMDSIIPAYATVIGNIEDAAGRFLQTALTFQSVVDGINAGAPVTIRTVEALNSRLVQLERAFIEPRGLPNLPPIRHVIFAPSIHDTYSGVVFAGVFDSVEYYKEAGQDPVWLQTIQAQLSIVQYCLESAILLLEGVDSTSY